MAVKKKGKNSNNTKKWGYLLLSGVFCLASFYGIYLWWTERDSAITADERGTRFIIYALFIVSFWTIAKFLFNKSASLFSGSKGEEIVEDMLDELPDDFLVFNNVKLHFEGKHTELDSLVVCPYGIYIIEVKNHNGDIEGLASDAQWTQNKIGRNGTPYSSKMRNPVKQLNFQVYLLSRILKKNKIFNWITGFVVFPSANSVSTDSDKVYTSQEEVMETIYQNGEIKLTRNQIHRIENVINQMMDNE